MAKINFFLGDIVGKVAGLVFQRGSSGSILRQKGVAVDSPSEIQTVKRAIFATLSRNYAYRLTQAQRDEWDALAAQANQRNVFGASYSITGANLFQSLNINLDTAGYSFIDDAPADLDVEGLIGVEFLELHTGQQSAVLGVDPFLPVGHDVVVRAVCNVSPGLSNVESLMKNAPVISAVGFAEQEFECLPLGLVFLVDKAVWVSVQFINTANGVLSAPVLLKGIVVTPP